LFFAFCGNNQKICIFSELSMFKYGRIKLKNQNNLEKHKRENSFLVIIRDRGLIVYYTKLLFIIIGFSILHLKS